MRFATMLAMIALAATGPAQAAKPIRVGDPAPDFELTMMDGTKIDRDSLRGQVVVLNFWATWCGPCRAELPLLDGYYRLREGKGLMIVAIATEDSLPARTLKPLFAAMKMPSARRIRGPFAAMEALPTNYVIDRAGIVRYAKTGAFDLQDLNTLLVPLLREPAPS